MNKYRRPNSRERMVAKSLVIVMAALALTSCRSSSVNAGATNTAATPVEASSPASAAGNGSAPNTLDVGKLLKQLQSVPAAVRQESTSVIRLAGASCTNVGCMDGIMGTAFGATIGGKVFEVTAAHVEDAPGLTCRDELLEGW